jgi:hypothetical protein
VDMFPVIPSLPATGICLPICKAPMAHIRNSGLFPSNGGTYASKGSSV